jgi:hypothetical protein
LFEEFGGNPSSVNFQTIAIGSACISAEENRKIELSCQGRPISAVKFASFGNPQGACGSFVKGFCEGSKDALSVVEKVSVYFLFLFYFIILWPLQPVNFSFLFFFTGMCWPGVVHH